jgi:hypothetical protein
MGKFILGGLFTVAILALVLFMLGVFEESQDGPLEEAAESVEEAVK